MSAKTIRCHERHPLVLQTGWDDKSYCILCESGIAGSSVAVACQAGCNFLLCLSCTPMYVESCASCVDDEKLVEEKPQQDLTEPTEGSYSSTLSGEVNIFCSASELHPTKNCTRGSNVYSCPSGHQLICQDGGCNNECDVCGTDIRGDAYSCRECYFDCCQSCANPSCVKIEDKNVAVQLAQKSAPVLSKCPSQHKLEQMVNEKSEHMCDICTANVPIGEQFYRCLDCDYDVCRSCRNSRCPNNHDCRQRLTHRLCSTTRQCNGCLKTITAGSFMDTCTVCDLHRCEECRVLHGVVAATPSYEREFEDDVAYSHPNQYQQQQPGPPPIPYSATLAVPPAPVTLSSRAPPIELYAAPPQTATVSQQSAPPMLTLPIAPPVAAPSQQGPMLTLPIAPPVATSVAAPSQQGPMLTLPMAPPISIIQQQSRPTFTVPLTQSVNTKRRVSVCSNHHPLKPFAVDHTGETVVICDVCHSRVMTPIQYGCKDCDFCTCLGCVNETCVNSHAQQTATTQGGQQQSSGHYVQQTANTPCTPSTQYRMGGIAVSQPPSLVSLTNGSSSSFSTISSSSMPVYQQQSRDDKFKRPLSVIRKFNKHGKNILEAYETVQTAVELGQAALEIGGAVSSVGGTVLGALAGCE